MTSIRNYSGKIYICGTCGQPAFVGEYGPQHFHEQWDGVYCPQHPMAGALLTVAWDDMSLDDVKRKYPDTYPSYSIQPNPQGAAG
jgi:hypothetical protein